MDFPISKYYETWDEESLEAGETDLKGDIYTNWGFSLRELVETIQSEGFNGISQYPITSLKNSIAPCHVWLSTIDPERDYVTGEVTFYTLHIKTTEKNFYRICKLAGLIKE